MSFRIALFGSHYYGYAMLETLLSLQQQIPELEVVGVASDDPTKSWVSPHKRLWQYPHTKTEEDMVANLATRNDIPVWRARIKDEDFYNEFTKKWMPDICYMGVFGQRIPENIWTKPLYGFYNFHSCAGQVWPSNTGAQAFEGMASNGEKQGAVAMHMIDNEFDHGQLIAFSKFFEFSDQETVLETFKRTSPYVAKLMAWHIFEVLGIPYPQDYKPRIIETQDYQTQLRQTNTQL
ncbi:MAG: hypothetical protein PHD48_08400 [Alphaproteobacteria bacterium]|nr:hypothetical protein [Alphaproteobacteria bacterium]